MIKFLTYIKDHTVNFILASLIFVALICALYGDVKSNYNFLNKITQDNEYSIALAFALTISLLIAALMQKKSKKICTAMFVLMLCSAVLSVGNFVLLKVVSGDERVNNDPMLSKWYAEKNRDKAKIDSLGIVYDNRVKLGLTKGARLQNSVDRLDLKITERELMISSVGNEIDQGFAGFGAIFGGILIGLSYPLIGIACPIAVTLLSTGLIYTSGIQIVDTTERQVKVFGDITERILKDYENVSFRQLNDPLIQDNTFTVSILTIRMIGNSVQNISIAEIGLRAAKVTGRSKKYSPAFVSEVMNHKYDHVLEKNRDNIDKINKKLLKRIKTQKLLVS